MDRNQLPQASLVERLNAFFDDPKDLSRLPLDPMGSIFATRPEADQDGMAVLGFSVRERKGVGETHQYQCNPAEYAFLAVATVLGTSIFINKTRGQPYLKIGGQMRKKSGIVVGRIFAGHEAGEATDYRNNDPTDLRHANLDGERHPVPERGREDVYAEILSRTGGPFAGTRAEIFRQRKALLDRALECLDQEAEVAAQR